MCGIVGWASSSLKGEDVPLERMRDQLLHRGPDDRGLWFSADHRAGLGHTRLSIIDLSHNAHQPMVIDRGRLAIVFNGEIYNFEDIKLELERSGDVFASRSDTEVILRAYRKWGTACVSRLDGMFAFAIYDASAQVVFLARDRVGEKPLYYTQVGGTLVWASEIKALLAWPRLRRRIDYDALRDYLSYGFVGGEDSILEGIRKLPPAHGLVFSLQKGEGGPLRYWEIPSGGTDGVPWNREARPPPVEELVAELKQLVVTSVKRRLIADVPTGILLSSGIDSGLVAAAAAQGSSAPITTYTVVNPGSPQLDEGPGARAVADAIGARHTELHVDGIDDSLLQTLARQYDEPIADQSIIPTYLVCRALRSQVKVALGGDGGDELFGGYPHYRLIAGQSAARRALPEAVRMAISRLAERALPIGFRGRNHLIGLAGDIGNAIAHVNVYFDQHSQAQLLGPHWIAQKTVQLARARHDKFAGRNVPAVLRAMQTDFLTVLPDSYLVKTDRASMLASMELRSPFLEPGIIDFAFNKVPDALRFDGVEQKILLRRLGGAMIPGWNPDRRKRGFTIPLGKWIEGNAGKQFKDILTDPGQTLFDKHYVEKLFALNRFGANNANRIFSLVMFELWRRQYSPDLPSR